MDQLQQFLAILGYLAVPVTLGLLVYEVRKLRHLAEDYFVNGCCHTPPTKFRHGYVVFMWDGHDWNVQVESCSPGCTTPPPPDTEGQYEGQCHVEECVPQ